MMRRGVILATALVVSTAALGAGVAPGLAVERQQDPAVTTYLARANKVCRSYANRLAKIAPPADPRSFADVERAVGKALPLLEAQAAAVRKVVPPRSLAARVKALDALVTRSNRYLRRALAAAKRRQRSQMGLAYGAWLAASADAHKAAVKLGFRCS
jgi:hypothetical protein